jgi:glutamine amidotransferase
METANDDFNLNYSVKVSGDINDVKKSDKIVLPGQGSFNACKAGIDNIKGLKEELNESALVKKKPIYGICAGMQLFATTGHEEEKTEGLNWIPGEVIKLNLGSSKFKVPHMGWNNVEQSIDHPLWQGIEQNSRFYFVHSYYVAPADPSYIAGRCHYGPNFAAALAHKNLFAVQFHPEKRADAGLQLLRNFCNWMG